MKNEKNLYSSNFKDAANASFFMSSLFGLIGFPLGHSFSADFFNKKFAEEKLNASFQNFELANISLFPQLVIDHPNLMGLSVTIPYKQTIIPYLDSLNEVAEKVGAVNSVAFKKGKLIGYNTDVIGFEKSLQPLLLSHHKKALILGTGGASLAVKYVLKKLGIEFLLVSRTKKKDSLIYEELNESIIKYFTLIINTTPLGTFPKIDEAPNIPYQFISEKHLLFDAVYNPSVTKFLSNGQQQKATIKNGLEMLQIQATASWKIWNQPTV